MSVAKLYISFLIDTFEKTKNMSKLIICMSKKEIRRKL